MDRITQLNAAIIKAIGQENRLKILQLLQEGEMCVNDILLAIDQEQSNVSRHLNHLHRCGVLTRRKEGLKTFYGIKHPEVLTLIELTSEISRKELAEGEPLLAF